jgi:hypothetical protein
MPSPFPGMDPWLEDPNGWLNIHVTFISEMKRTLNVRLPPKHVALGDYRAYSSDEHPGYLLTEPRLRIIAVGTSKLVTVIELVSPASKVLGSSARASLLAERRSVLESEVHWVEIDLLRAGVRTPLKSKWDCDYRVLVSRFDNRSKPRVWPIRWKERLPQIEIPVSPPDPDVGLDLQEVFSAVYDASACDCWVNYQRPPVPPWSEAHSAVADTFLWLASRRGVSYGDSRPSVEGPS